MTGDKRQVPFSKQVMGENDMKNTSNWRNFLMARIFHPKMWRGGAKIKLRGGAAVALMQWRENFS